jgi:hypothetical protein
MIKKSIWKRSKLQLSPRQRSPHSGEGKESIQHKVTLTLFCEEMWCYKCNIVPTTRVHNNFLVSMHRDSCFLAIESMAKRIEHAKRPLEQTLYDLNLIYRNFLCVHLEQKIGLLKFLRNSFEILMTCSIRI